MDPRDPQQFLFYRLEREEIGARNYARLSFATCKLVARSVCRQYGVPQVRVRRKKMGKWAAEYDPNPTPKVITLNPVRGTSTDLLTILHELAHHIHQTLAPNEAEGQEIHGPQFVACYMSVLDTVRLIPRDAMAIVLQRRGIRYINPGPTVQSLRAALRGDKANTFKVR
jgi:putative metallohydrolase (TIGR04338 family)